MALSWAAGWADNLVVWKVQRKVVSKVVRMAEHWVVRMVVQMAERKDHMLVDSMVGPKVGS